MCVRAVFVVMTCLALGLLAGCREVGDLDMPAFPAGAKSTASADVTLGPFALWLTRGLMSDGDPEAEQMKRIFQGIKSVRVRSYQLIPGSPLPEAQIAALRLQLYGPGWSRLAETHDRHQGEDMEVYVAQDEHAFRGLAVLSTSPEEVTVVNVVGTIDPRDIKRLGELAQAHAHKRGETAPVSER